MKRYEKYILKASEQIKLKFAQPNTIIVPDVYKGYIASFASSIRQSGLIAAISFYTSKSNDKKSTDYRRNALMKAIHVLVNGTEGELIEFALKKTYGETVLQQIPLRNLPQPNMDELQVFQTQIEDAAIALKLALRSFDLQKI